MNKLQPLAEFPSYVHPSPEAQALHDQLNKKIAETASRHAALDADAIALQSPDALSTDAGKHAKAIATYHDRRIQLLRDQFAIAQELDCWAELWDRERRQQLADAMRDYAEAGERAEQFLITAGWLREADGTCGAAVRNAAATHPATRAARIRMDAIQEMLVNKYLMVSGGMIAEDIKVDLEAAFQARMAGNIPFPTNRPAARHRGRILQDAAELEPST